MHSWGFQTLTLSLFTIVRRCTDQLAARSDTDEPRRPPSPHRLGLAWLARRLRRWSLGRSSWARYRERFTVARVRRRRGYHRPHGGTIRRWLVGDGLALHVRFGMI